MMFLGNTQTKEVFWSDGKAKTSILPFKSQKMVNHSPDGFNWGYAGSGPSQLALAILVECTSNENAMKLHQQFKMDIIAKLPRDQDFELPFRVVYDWIVNHTENQNENLAPTTPVS